MANSNSLYSQEELVKFIFQTIRNIPVGVFVLDRKTAELITCNVSCAHLHGYPSITSMKGVIYWQLLLPMDFDKSIRILRETRFFQGELRVFTQNQDILTIDLTLLDLPQIGIIIGLIREISQKPEEKEEELPRLTDLSSTFLRMMISETSEQLLRAHGWLDILHSKTTFPERLELIRTVIGVIEKLETLNRQINEFAVLKTAIESPLQLVSFSRFQENLSVLISLLIESKGCQIQLNCFLEKPDQVMIPEILTIAIDQILQYSLIRNSQNITINVDQTPDNQIQFNIYDDGKAFLETPETPGTSEFLKDIYLTDVLLRQIGGKVNVKDILPKEGLKISLIFPLNPKLILNSS